MGVGNRLLSRVGKGLSFAAEIHGSFIGMKRAGIEPLIPSVPMALRFAHRFAGGGPCPTRQSLRAFGRRS